MKNVAVLIDGGHVRVLARNAGMNYNPDYIEKIAKACVEPDEDAFRFFYYDCAPDSGTVKLPVSARIAGLQIVLIGFPNRAASNEMLCHADIERRVAWPAQ